jgi:hypothetical protein
LLIVGHADDSNAEETNRRIARFRAAEVLWQLRSRLQQRGLNMPMDYEGRGSTEPVATGGGEADHKRNRRVEVLYCPDEPVAVGTFSYPVFGWRRFWRPRLGRRMSLLRRPWLAGPRHRGFPGRTVPRHAFPRAGWRGTAVPKSLVRPMPIRLPTAAKQVSRRRVPAPRRMSAPHRSAGRARSR